MNAKVRAVIAEDEPHARQSLREWLRGVDWIDLVGEAADGLEAVRLVDALEPDLLFLDVRLPELSGLEVARRLRQRNRTPRPLIVAVTGWGKPEDETLSREAGFDLHMVKPVEELDVLKILRTHSGIVH